ncbi:MAG: hypothetical protein IJM62_01245 [Lachnospiraceae bacterium]|nr:hypothetical protein [Lachnospiraceae bacterium]
MTLEEAEKFYKEYDGKEFHMYREEPRRYGEFDCLSVPPEIRRKWDAELADGIFASLWDDPGRVWSRHSRLIDVLKRNCSKADIDRLLDEMEKMTTLDKRSRILITENMAGRNDTRKGGCMVICRSKAHIERMERIMNSIMDFTLNSDDESNDMGWTDTAGRYKNAVAAYRSALKKWR